MLMNRLISTKNADQFLLNNRLDFETVLKDLSQCIGNKLSEDIIADRPYPPYNRVAMDGIAVASSHMQEGKNIFFIEGVQKAGMPAMSLKNNKNCLEVMTGAMLPKNTDTVINYEQISIKGRDAFFEGNIGKIKNKNIHFYASDYKTKDILVNKGTILNMTHISIAASVGKQKLLVYNIPKIALVSTGDELVPINKKNIESWQIRYSNLIAIQADLEKFYRVETHHIHLSDDYIELKNEFINICNQYDIFIITGGVSKGKFDFIPKVLQDIGVTEVFHKVKQKPGKPFWFGKTEKQVFFGLPGNPVSSQVCYKRFVIPYLLHCLNLTIRRQKMRFTEDVILKEGFTHFISVRKLKNSINELCSSKTNGSGDFASLVQSDGFVELCQGSYKKGDKVPFYSWLTDSLYDNDKNI